MYNYELNERINTFQSIRGTVSRTLKRKTRKEANLKLYKVMAVHMLLYCSETWMFEEERLE
jgi:hypothetical protein